MKKIKNIKYLFSLSISILLISYLVLAPFFVFPHIFALQNEINKNEELDYTGIVELWNVDTFEGGSISRAYWLEEVAIKFEKENRGVFVVVQNMNLEQLILNLNNNNCPDMISFGLGAGGFLTDMLTDLNTDFSIRADLQNAGKYNGNCLAIPYLMGGYSIITVQNGGKQKLGVGLNSNTCPLLTLFFNEINFDNLFESNLNVNSFNCYDYYLKNNFNVLLGTQRDVYRVNRRVEKGMMTEQNFAFLQGFTDLVQYIGVTKKADEKTEICKLFVENLLQTQTQESLKNINMFSVKIINLYSAEPFASMESVLNRDIKTLNVFLETSVIKNINEMSYSALQGDEDAKNNIIKYLI